MADEKKKFVVPEMPQIAHSDDMRSALNNVVAIVNLHSKMLDPDWVAPVPDPIADWAHANGLGHMTRGVQEVAYRSMHPDAKPLDPIEEYARVHNVAHLGRTVVEAMYNQEHNPVAEPDNTGAVIPVREPQQEA